MPKPTHASIPAWNRFEAELAELCIEVSLPLARALGIVARKYSSDAADSLMLACISFCTNYDHVFGFGKENSLEGSLQRYQIITVLAADIACLGKGERRCSDLVKHWVTSGDRFFTL